MRSTNDFGQIAIATNKTTCVPNDTKADFLADGRVNVRRTCWFRIGTSTYSKEFRPLAVLLREPVCPASVSLSRVASVDDRFATSNSRYVSRIVDQSCLMIDPLSEK